MLRVLKATPDLVAIHKPAGVPFHSTTNTQGLLSLLRDNPPPLVQQQRLYAVHRLDTGTSGVILFATSRETAGLVAKAFRNRQVSKYYLALSDRKPKQKQGTIRGDMAPGRRGAWKLLRTCADPAVTRFWSTSLAGAVGRPGLRLFLVKPETGRTHQIRVALKAIGAAIVGDGLYGAASAATQADRLYLHAAALRVPLPGGGCFQVVDMPGGSSSSSSSGGGGVASSSSSGDDGLLFQHPAVQQLLLDLLPKEDDRGPWFPGNKLFEKRKRRLSALELWRLSALHLHFFKCCLLKF